MENSDRTSVFVSYCHRDKRWLDRLRVHLKSLERDFDIDLWDDTRIRPGDLWKKEIEAAVDRCNVAILLVSADFIASDFISTNEVPPLLKSAEENGARILPIIVSPCLFLRKQALSQFPSVNDPSDPLIGMQEGQQEAVFLRVSEELLDDMSSRSKRLSTVDAGHLGEAKLSENFLDAGDWDRLIKIGSWVTHNNIIIGQDQGSYLLSREEYGVDDESFEISCQISFSNIRHREGIGFNAGVLLGWNEQSGGFRYINLLIGESGFTFEKVGFSTGKPGEYDHISQLIETPIERATVYNICVSVGKDSLKAKVNDSPELAIPRPTGVGGRVGLRPWRSTMDCSAFVVKATG
jgi:TIR domain